MGTIIDLRDLALPSTLMFKGQDLAPELLKFIGITVTAWTASGQLSRKMGYGLASTAVVPTGTLMRVNFNEPAELLGFGIATRGAAPHYPWNALRKMGMLARARALHGAFSSSLEVVKTRPEFPRDTITPAEREVEKAGGLIRWGDFPYGGAVYRTDGEREVMMGVSIWKQEEDHRLIGAAADRVLELAAGVG